MNKKTPGNNGPDTRSISEMRNLGPRCEQDLRAAGIVTAEDVKRLGAEETFFRMMVARVRSGQSTRGCTATYLYAIYGAIHDLDWRAIPEDRKTDFKALAAQIRESL